MWMMWGGKLYQPIRSLAALNNLMRSFGVALGYKINKQK